LKGARFTLLANGQIEAKETVVRIAVALLALVLAGTAGAVSGPHASRTQALRSISVRSTLDRKTVLPHRIVWQAFAQVPSSSIEEVDFLVDGKLRWVEHKTPYIYSGLDGRGYLVSSWLAPGFHRFTVFVKASGGRSGSTTVRARVLPTPNAPPALAGTWKRTVDNSSAPAAGNPTSTPTPSGGYTLTFEKRWARDQFPGSFVLPQSNDSGEGLYFLDDYTADQHTIHVVGEVVFHPFSDSLPEGGSWCYFDGPPATYTWVVRGDSLTLAPVGGKDACGVRGFIWTGTWTRIH
jgi:hypothetical protein